MIFILDKTPSLRLSLPTMTQAPITVTIAYLGGSRGQTGCERETLELPPTATLNDAIALVVQKYPALRPFLASARWARNFEFAQSEETLKNGDEIALLPPVCGGAPRTHLHNEAINAEHLLKRISNEEFGATCLFVGTVRRHSHGHEVTHIDYEAYQPMAGRQLERIAQQVCVEISGVELLIEHRHGRLAVGDVSIAIAAAAAHRDEAFRACRAAIEYIKKDLPIWKCEFGPAGAHWHGWGGG